jgi:pyrroloquinoline quinone biosynthesis protein D
MLNHRAVITEASVPKLPAGVRLHFDGRRDRWVILAPERLFVLDAIALEILRRCDGNTKVGDVAADLAEVFAAPVATILDDVRALLQDLADKNVLIA